MCLFNLACQVQTYPTIYNQMKFTIKLYWPIWGVSYRRYRKAEWLIVRFFQFVPWNLNLFLITYLCRSTVCCRLQWKIKTPIIVTMQHVLRVNYILCIMTLEIYFGMSNAFSHIYFGMSNAFSCMYFGMSNAFSYMFALLAVSLFKVQC